MWPDRLSPIYFPIIRTAPPVIYLPEKNCRRYFKTTIYNKHHRAYSKKMKCLKKKWTFRSTLRGKERGEAYQNAFHIVQIFFSLLGEWWDSELLSRDKFHWVLRLFDSTLILQEGWGHQGALKHCWEVEPDTSPNRDLINQQADYWTHKFPYVRRSLRKWAC